MKPIKLSITAYKELKIKPGDLRDPEGRPNRETIDPKTVGELNFVLTKSPYFQKVEVCYSLIKDGMDKGKNLSIEELKTIDVRETLPKDIDVKAYIVTLEQNYDDIIKVSECVKNLIEVSQEDQALFKDQKLLIGEMDGSRVEKMRVLKPFPFEKTNGIDSKSAGSILCFD